jgi:hypothetical protein
MRHLFVQSKLQRKLLILTDWYSTAFPRNWVWWILKLPLAENGTRTGFISAPLFFNHNSGEKKKKTCEYHLGYHVWQFCV